MAFPKLEAEISSVESTSASTSTSPAVSETQLNALLEEEIRSSQDFFVLLSSSFEVIYKNDVAKNVLGRLSHGVPGEDLLHIIAQKDLAMVTQEVFPLALQGKPWQGEVSLVGPGSMSAKTYHWDVRPLFGRNTLGAVEALSLVGKNVTEVRRLEARSERMALSLEHERRSLRTLFEQAPIGIAVLEGPRHVYSYANPAYLSFLPKEEGEIIGKPLLEAFPEMAGQGFDTILDEVYRTGKSFSGRDLPADLKNADGTTRRIYVDLVYHARYDINGHIDGIIAVGSDVTSRREAQVLAEEKTREFSALSELMPQILFTMDETGFPTYFNEKWFDYTGFARTDVVHWQDALCPTDTGKVLEALSAGRKTEQPMEVEFALRRADGHYRWHLCRALPVRNSAHIERIIS